MDRHHDSIWPRLMLILIFTVGSLSILVVKASMVRSPNDQNVMDELRVMTRDGLGREASLALPGATPDQSRVAVASVRTFIRQRSGLDMGDAVESRLADMEAMTLSAHARHISSDELTDLLTQTLLERVRTLKDEEISRAANLLGCADCTQADAIPDKAKVRPRASGEGTVSAKAAIDAIKRVRDQAVISSVLLPMISLARSGIAREIKRRLTAFSYSLPEQWGNVDSEGLTPLQAYLVAYSVAADDYLWYSQANLQSVMKRAEQMRLAADGQSAGSSESSSPSLDSRLNQRTAFGVNGYIFSSPLDLILDKETTTRLLDHIEERSRL
ncbi:MAG: hypothetical protein V7641_1716 [Blastocatellia bacterium]